MIGTVVVEGATFGIFRIDITGGAFEIHAEAMGPLPALSGPATVFGADGVGACQSWDLRVPAARAGEHVEVVLPVRMIEVTIAGQAG